VYEETLTYDTSVQKATSDNYNVDAVQRHAMDITQCEQIHILLKTINILLKTCSHQLQYKIFNQRDDFFFLQHESQDICAHLCVSVFPSVDFTCMHDVQNTCAE